MKKLFIVFVGFLGLLAGSLTFATDSDIQLTADISTIGQTLTVNKYFANSFKVDWGDETAEQNVTAAITHTYTSTGNYTITLTMTSGTRWTFQNAFNPLVPKSGTTASNIYISSIPSLSGYFGNNATAPGDYFFSSFNRGGALTSLPVDSFDTSNIITVGTYFFSSFNYNGALTFLPEGSFDISNITTVAIYFFSFFNYNGALTRLSEGSFDTSKITTVGSYFFSSFNENGALTSLPVGSFQLSSGLTTAGNDFFYYFNRNGALTLLPVGSFDISNITTVGTYFFGYFNYNGALTSLPVGSFDTSNIITVGSNFFYAFNYNGKITRNTTTGIGIKNVTSSAVTFYYRTGSTQSLSVPAGTSFQYYQSTIPLTITGTLIQTGKLYDGTTAITIISGGTLSGIVDTFPDVQLLITGSYDTATAGIEKTITVSYALTGTDAPLYSAPEDEYFIGSITEELITPPDVNPPIVNPPQTSGGGGGGTSLKADSCLAGDLSPSYYDGTCGTTSDLAPLVEAKVNVLRPLIRLIYITATEKEKTLVHNIITSCSQMNKKEIIKLACQELVANWDF